MSHLPGNPHYTQSFGALQRIEGVRMTYQESENTLRGAQVTATLALAYEQRTANLIAMQALRVTTGRANEIQQRLGATK